MGESKQQKIIAGIMRAHIERGRSDYSLPEWAWRFVSTVPTGWNQIPSDFSTRAFQHQHTYLTVIVSGGGRPDGLEEDGKRWLHVSFAHGDRIPSWNDMRDVKAAFIGDDKKAIFVLPSKEEYINVNPYCLHLWHCLDGDGLPDFRSGRPSGHI